MFFPLSPSVCITVPPMFSPLCSSPAHYHTWPPPSSLSSPVPRLVISVCVCSPCLPCSPCQFFVSVCICSCSCSCPCDAPCKSFLPCLLSCLLVCVGFCVLHFLIWTFAFFLCTLSNCCHLLLCLAVVLLLCFFLWTVDSFLFTPWFLWHSALVNKARLLFLPFLASCPLSTAFGSTSPFHGLPLYTPPWQNKQTRNGPSRLH